MSNGYELVRSRLEQARAGLLIEISNEADVLRVDMGIDAAARIHAAVRLVEQLEWETNHEEAVQ